MTKTLDTLIELATKQSDEAARRLGMAVRACEDTEQKLTMLIEYREEYDQRFQNAMLAGLSMHDFHNYQSFLLKLDTAIAGQQKIVDGARQRITNERSVWQTSEKKRMSYGTLANRAQQAALKKENKRDQKMMDEFATRQANYRR